jgi:hypothetical protein
MCRILAFSKVRVKKKENLITIISHITIVVVLFIQRNDIASGDSVVTFIYLSVIFRIICQE